MVNNDATTSNDYLSLRNFTKPLLPCRHSGNRTAYLSEFYYKNYAQANQDYTDIGKKQEKSYEQTNKCM